MALVVVGVSIGAVLVGSAGSGAVQRVAAVLVLVFVRAERAVFRAGAVTRDNVRVAGARCDCCWRAALTPSRGLARQRGVGGVVCGCGY